MQRSTALELDLELLQEAERRARSQNQTLAAYVEKALRHELARSPAEAAKPMIELRGPIPEEIRQAKPVPLRGESKRRRAARGKLFQAVLDLGGVRR